MTDEKLAEIKARCDAASPGPWVDAITDAGDLIITVNGAGCMPFIYLGDMENTESDDHNNATFIAHARTDIPDLLAEVERLRADRDHARKQAKFWYLGALGDTRALSVPETLLYDALADMPEEGSDGWSVGQSVGGGA